MPPGTRARIAEDARSWSPTPSRSDRHSRPNAPTPEQNGGPASRDTRRKIQWLDLSHSDEFKKNGLSRVSFSDMHTRDAGTSIHSGTSLQVRAKIDTEKEQHMRAPIFVIAVLCWLIGAGCAAAGERLRVATEGAYPPFNYIDATGQLAGFDIDIAHALCRELAAPCEIAAVLWDDLLPALAAGKHDFVIASMAKTPERETLADFSVPYYRTRSVFIGRSDRTFMLSGPGLKGLRLISQAATVQDAYLRQTYGSVATIIGADTFIEAYRRLTTGDADLLLADTLTSYEFLRSEQGATFDVVGDPLPEDALPSAVHIQVRKGNDALRVRINQGLERIRLSGEFHRINQKYFPFSIY